MPLNSSITGKWINFPDSNLTLFPTFFTFEFRKHLLNVHSRVLKASVLYSIWWCLTALQEVFMQNYGCTWQLAIACLKKAGAACTERKQLPKFLGKALMLKIIKRNLCSKEGSCFTGRQEIKQWKCQKGAWMGTPGAQESWGNGIHAKTLNMGLVKCEGRKIFKAVKSIHFFWQA